MMDKFGEWIPCSERLPKIGQDVILFFHDSIHTHPSWEKTPVMPAWICNVGEEASPNGEWAIEGRFGGNMWVEPLDSGIAWMPLPNPPDFE